MCKKNYYLLLGLPFDPPTANENEILLAINRYVHSESGLSQDEKDVIASDMKSLLLSSDRTDDRKAEADRAAKIFYEPLDRIIQKMANMSVPPAFSLNWVGRIASATGFAPNIVLRRLESLNDAIIPVSDPPARLYKGLMNEISEALLKVGAGSLEEYISRFFSNPLRDDTSIWDQPDSALYTAINTAVKKTQNKKDDQFLAKTLMDLFNNKKMLAQYELELRYAPIYQLAERTALQDQSGILIRNEKESAHIFEQVKTVEPDEKQAVLLFQSLFFHPFAMPMPEKSSKSLDVVICCSSCGSVQRLFSQSKKNCRKCGGVLTKKCIQCGRYYLPEQLESACPNCGYDSADHFRAQRYLTYMDLAMQTGQLDLAIAFQEKAIKLDPIFTRNTLDQKSRNTLEEALRLSKAKKYYELSKFLEKTIILENRQELLDKAHVSITRAESLLNALPGQDSMQQYRTLRSVLSLCSDIPDFSVKASAFLPPQVQNIQCTVHDRRLEVQWEYPPFPEARFSICMREVTGNGVFQETMVCTGLDISSHQLPFPDRETLYLIRAELFGIVSPWSVIGRFGVCSSHDWISSTLTTDGMLLSWSFFHTSDRLLLRHVRGSDVSSPQVLAPDATTFLDPFFSRTGITRYILSGDTEDGLEASIEISAGLAEHPVRIDESPSSLLNQCICRYDPSPNVTVAWRLGDAEECPLPPGIYTEGEIGASGPLVFEPADKGIKIFTLSPYNDRYIQPIWKGGGCLRVGEALFPPCRVPPFREIEFFSKQFGLYHLSSPWPDHADGAVITACATRYAKPDSHCGEITAWVFRENEDSLSADIPWTMTQDVCIAVYAFRRINKTFSYSIPCKLPVTISKVTYTFRRAPEKNSLCLTFSPRKHTVYRPAIAAVSEDGSEQLHVADAGILAAGQSWETMVDLPVSPFYTSAAWETEDHDLFTLEKGDS